MGRFAAITARRRPSRYPCLEFNLPNRGAYARFGSLASDSLERHCRSVASRLRIHCGASRGQRALWLSSRRAAHLLQRPQPPMGICRLSPVTAFLARIELALFGTSLVGFRFFVAIACGFVAVLTGLMARAMGGGRQAMLVSAFAASIGGYVFFTGSFMSYMSFDLLCWVAVAWSMVRLPESGDVRWWLGTGATIGLGLMTKYTMAFFAAALLGAMLLPQPPLHLQRLVLVWRGAGAAGCRAQSLVAVAASFRQPCLDAQHPRSRHWPGSHRQLSGEPVVANYQPWHGAALARRALVSLCAARRQAVADARLDVRAFARVPDGRPGPRPLPCPRLRDAFCRRSSAGRKLAPVASGTKTDRAPEHGMDSARNQRPGDCSPDAPLLLQSIRCGGASRTRHRISSTWRLAGRNSPPRSLRCAIPSPPPIAPHSES